MARSVLVTTQKPEQQPKRSLISNGKVVQTTPEQQLSDAYDAAVSTPVLDKATAGKDMNFFQKAWGLFENAGAAGIGGLRNIINDAGYRSQAAAPLLAGDDAYYKAMMEQSTGKQNTGVQIPEDTRTPEQRELDEYMGLGPSYTPEARAMAQAIEDSYKKLDETGVTRTTSLGDKYAQEVAEKYAGAGDKWQRAYGISQSAGQQVLPMAAKYIPVVGPLLSSLMFFGQASGGASDEALADGADWDKALTYGTAIGGIEAGTEALGDLGKKAVISTLGKSASTGSFGKALAGVLSNNNAVRTLLGVLGNATSEGGEEVLSDLISPFAKSIYNDKSLGENWRDEVTVQKLWDDFLGGFAVGGLMDGARALTGGYRGQNQNYQNETVNQAIQDARTAAKEHGIFSDESIAATMEVAQAIETLEGQQAIAAQDANRYRQIVNEMKRAQNGDIGAQERLTALLATEASRNREDGAQFPADINALVAAQRRAYIEEQTQADPEKAAAAQEILERYGVDLPEAQTDIMTVERFAEIDNARAGRTAGQEQAQSDLSQTAAPASPAETAPLNTPVNTEVTPSAAQTMARAAQNPVQETAPAQTEVSPAAQTMAQVLLGNREPLQQNIDTNTATAYNNIENNLLGGSPNGGAETDGNRIAREGLRLGRDGAEADSVISDGREADGRGNLQVSGIVLLSQEAQNTLKARGVDIVETQDVSANSTAFSHALDDARSADADHGWAVTPKTAEELSENGVRSFMDANGSTGFAIAQDGDIEAVFSNKAKGAPKGATKSTIPQAIALGGTKLDCYGSNLVKLYQQYGFVPVARVKFNPEYANPGWDASKGMPDIYFMMHNGDSADTVVQKTGTYTPLTTADLAALPEMDYDTAYAYRDNLLAQRGKQSNAEDAQGANAEPLTPIAQAVLGNAKATNPNTTVRSPLSPTSPDTPTRLSQTAETVRDAGVTTEKVRQDINTGIEDGKYRYIPESNADAVSSVRSAIAEKGYESVLRDWTADVRSGKTSNDLAAAGAVLYNEAVQSGNTRLALDILTDYQLLGTNTAQGLQAMRIIKDLTPQDRMYMVKKSIDKLYDNLSDGTKKKLPDGFNINEELLDRFVNAPDAKSETEAMQDIQTDIARQIPNTFMDRLTALRYLNMLGNFRTQIRNLAGNTGMGITAGVKNTVRYMLERAAEAVTGGKYQRNTSLTVSPEMMKAARADYDTNADFVNGDAKYNDSMSSDSFARGVRDAQRPFTSENKFANALMKPLDLWSRGTNWAMTKGDTVFIKQQYARYLGGYLEAHKMNADTFAKIVSGDIQPTAEQLQTIDNGRLFAAKEAQEATFHDTNAFSSWVSQIGRKPGTPWYGRLIGEGIAPFRKTPANVAVRAVEYSPLGFFDTVNKAVQAARGKNGVSGSDVINSLSKSLTGTGLFALGMMLRDAGWLRGTEDDEKQEAFDKLQGQQDYSLVLPDGTNVTMDWLSPAAIPMFMGVALMDEIDDGGFAVSDVLDVITRLSDPMIQMSMLQGVNDTLDSVKYSGNSLGQVALNTMLSYAMQGLTNTMFGQAERTFEDRRYSTFLDADTPTGKTLQSKLGKALAKIPGIDYNQVEYVDAWGRTEYSGGLGARAFENFISPGYLSRQNSTEVDSELQRLYDAGQTNVFPSRIAMSQTVNVYNNQGKKLEERSLTPDEYVQFQKVMGQTSLEMVKDLMKSPVYKGMSDASKAEAISDIYSYAKDMAAMTVEPSEKLARQSDVSGLSNPAAYYAALASFGTASKDSDNRNYSELDALMSSFKRLPSDVQSAVTEKNSNFAKVYDAKENGFTSQQYFRVYDAVKDLAPAEGYSGVATWQKVSAICTMNTSDKEKDYFVGNYFSGGAYDRYLTAREAGFSPASVAVAYQTYQLSKGVDKNGDGRNDSGTKKAAFIAAMMEQGASRKSAEWLYKLFASNK